MFWQTRKKNILGSERGATSLELMIVIGVFVFIAVIATLAMFGTGGQGTRDVVEAIEEAANHIEENIVDNVEQAKEDAVEVKETLSLEACLYFCELDYENGLDNVVQYQECLSDCAQ